MSADDGCRCGGIGEDGCGGESWAFLAEAGTGAVPLLSPSSWAAVVASFGLTIGACVGSLTVALACLVGLVLLVAVLLASFMLGDRREMRAVNAAHEAEAQARYIAATALRRSAVEAGYSLTDPLVLARIDEAVERHTPRRAGVR